MSDLRKRYCCDGMYMKSVYSFKYSVMETWILEICCRSWDFIANRSSVSNQQSCSGCGISPAGTCFEEIKLCVGLRQTLLCSVCFMMNSTYAFPQWWMAIGWTAWTAGLRHDWSWPLWCRWRFTLMAWRGFSMRTTLQNKRTQKNCSQNRSSKSDWTWLKDKWMSEV